MGMTHRAAGLVAAIALLTACGSLGSTRTTASGTASLPTGATVDTAGITDPTEPVTTANEPPPPSEPSPSAAESPTTVPNGEDRWEVADLGPSAADVGAVFATAGDRTLMIAALGPEGGPMRLSAIPVAANSAGSIPVDIAITDRSPWNVTAAGGPPGWVVAANVPLDQPDDPANFVPSVWMSADGVTWAQSGFPESAGPLDINEIIWTGTSFLAVAAKRLDEVNPSMGPFGAGLYRSADGRSWSEVPLDPAVFGQPARDDNFTDVVLFGDRLIAVKQVPGGEFNSLRMFASADEGATWQSLEATGAVPERTFVVGEALLGWSYGLGDSREPGLSRFADGGWTPLASEPNVLPRGTQDGFFFGDAGALVAQLGVETPIELCYDDPERCSRGYQQIPVIVTPDPTSEQGASIHRMAIPAGLDEYARIAGAGTTVDGRLAVLWRTEAGWRLTSWSPNGDPRYPISATPAPEEPVPGPPIINWADDIEPGVVYRFPLYVHCDMTWLQLDGRVWKTDAHAPRDVMVNGLQQLLGEIEMTAPDRLEYSLPDRGVIAVYTPTDEEPPGCE